MSLPWGAVRPAKPCTSWSRVPRGHALWGAMRPGSRGPRGCWVPCGAMGPGDAGCVSCSSLLCCHWCGICHQCLTPCQTPRRGGRAGASCASLGSGPPTAPPSPAPPPLKPHLQGAEGQAAGLQRGDALGQVVGLLGLPLLLLLVPALLGLGQHQALQGQGPLSPPGPPGDGGPRAGRLQPLLALQPGPHARRGPDRARVSSVAAQCGRWPWLQAGRARAHGVDMLTHRPRGSHLPPSLLFPCLSVSGHKAPRETLTSN